MIASIPAPWVSLCLSGIQEHAAEQGWRVLTCPPTLETAGEWSLSVHALRDWPGDGIILATNNPAELRAARRLPIPVVNLTGGNASGVGIPRVMVNHEKIGRIAAEHLLERGFRHLAYYGIAGPYFSKERERGFTLRSAEAGIPAEVFTPPRLRNARAGWRERIDPLCAWLRQLPKPVGILAAQDYRARMLADVCEETGLRMPEEIAVMGVDNDAAICAFHHPTLTSVSRNSRAVGRAAAELLGSLMNGARPPRSDILLDPDGVVARSSTASRVISDPLVRAATATMQAQLATAGSIKELAHRLEVSRRSLEERFRRELGLAPQAYWQRLRIARAQGLLETSNRARLADIAGQ